MQDKDTQKKLAKILVLSDMLLNEIDDPAKTPNKGTKLIQDKARELQQLLIPVVDSFYNNKSVSKSTIFNTLHDKFNYIFDKEYR